MIRSCLIIRAQTSFFNFLVIHNNSSKIPTVKTALLFQSSICNARNESVYDISDPSQYLADVSNKATAQTESFATDMGPTLASIVNKSLVNFDFGFLTSLIISSSLDKKIIAMRLYSWVF
jgi:hypothetical protein